MTLAIDRITQVVYNSHIPKRGKMSIKNIFDINLIPESLQRALFGAPYTSELSEEIASKCFKELEKYPRSVDYSSSPDLNLDLDGARDVTEYVQKVSKEQASRYTQDIEEFLNADIPQLPQYLVKQQGWTRYAPGQEPQKVSYPLERVFTFDTEVLVHDSLYPLIASAQSKDAWYIWLSPRLKLSSTVLVPCGYNKIIIGHNINYDTARIEEERHLENSGNVFIDTQSLHMAIGGIGNQQRALFAKSKNSDSNFFQQDWTKEVTTNSLGACMQHYCGIEVDKTVRDDFIDRSKTVSSIWENILKYVRYNILDVKYTTQLSKVLIPRFLRAAGSQFTLTGNLIKSTCKLYVNEEEWRTWHDECELKVQNLLGVEMKGILVSLAEETLTLNPWDSFFTVQLDWSIKPNARKNKGKPEWYRNLWGKEAMDKLTIRSRVTPLLLNLHWKENPLFYLQWLESPDGSKRVYIWDFPQMALYYWDKVCEHPWSSHEEFITKLTNHIERFAAKDQFQYFGVPWTCNDLQKKVLRSLGYTLKGSWGYLEIVEDESNTSTFIQLPFRYQSSDKESIRWFYVPHKNGPDENCGDPLAKDYLSSIELGDLHGIQRDNTDLAEKALKTASSCSYWVSIRERVRQQWLVPLPGVPGMCSIIPGLRPIGTLTRRGVEPLWLTASNCKPNRIGSNLKSKVKAPPGWKVVRADVDSQELWLTALLGESVYGEHGSTPFGQQILTGSKKEGTDFHTVTREFYDIPQLTRDINKTLNYAVIYGCGIGVVIKNIMLACKSLPPTELKQKAKLGYTRLKGHKVMSLDRASYVWANGLMSLCFNVLEKIANQPVPRSPVADFTFPVCLQPYYVDKQFLPPRINCVVQSSGSDMADLLLTLVDALCRKEGIEYKFTLCIHDEYNFMVPEKHAVRFAYLFQIAHLITKSYIAKKLGFNSLPASVAWFEEVDIDHCLRKSWKEPQITISSGLLSPNGPQDEPQGQGLTISQLIDIMNQY